ncbi:MAG: virulence factor [Helicobacteraceae bacterium]|nr:virulence factor [Helicobacteraceae bacterium]
MYAVIFDINTDRLKENYIDLNIANDVYGAIKKFMIANGFEWKQDSVYFGTERINAVTCVSAIQKLARELPSLANCVRDIRMLKIEENNDLMPAVLLA